MTTAVNRCEGSVSCLRESRQESALPRQRTPERHTRADGDLSMKLRKADTFLTGKVLREDGKPAAGALVAAESGDGQKNIGYTDSDGEYRLYAAREELQEDNKRIINAVYESAGRAYYRSRTASADISGTGAEVSGPELNLKRIGIMPDTEIVEFNVGEGMVRTLSDRAQIQIPADAVPGGMETAIAVFGPLFGILPDIGGNYVLSYGYSVSLFSAETGSEITGKLSRDIQITLFYTGSQLRNAGARSYDVCPARFSEDFDSWLPENSFTSDETTGKITFRTDLASSVWALTVSEKGGTPVPGDMDGDGGLGLRDIVMVLQVCTDTFSVSPKEADVSGDGKIGPADAVYLLRKVAE